jgi:hypothetical protein
MKIKIYFLTLVSFFLTSCVPLIKGVFGNKIMDSNYNPLPQEQNYFVEVPYIMQDGQIVIKVRINNSEKEYNFFFDTGADTVISEELLSELNISNLEESVALDAHGHYSTGSTFRADLSLDSLFLRNIRISSAKSELFKQKCNDKRDGIIGWNVLKQGYFYFNPVKKTLIITNDKAKLPKLVFENKIQLKRKMARPYIKIKGKRSIWVLLDTGYADGYISTNRDSGFLDNNLIVTKNKSVLVSSLNSAKQMDREYYLHKTTFGKISKLQQIVVSDLKGSRIGNKILQDNHVIIDVTHNSLYVSPVSKEDDKFEISNIGFTFKDRNVFVASLVNNSVFGRAGIQMNDTIIRLNEFKVSDLKDYCEYNEVFNKLKFPLTIILKNNDIKITCTREQYYE